MNKIDMRGKPCPIPVIEAKKKLQGLNAGESLSVLVDNDIARQNLEKMAKGLGHDFSFTPKTDGTLEVVIGVASAVAGATGQRGRGLVVAISNDSMGAPSEELGKTLMKSFIYSLTELPEVPEHILFFNGGVHLACQGASTLEDLHVLSAKGCQVSSCGACLNYYNLTDELKAGNVTNMFSIVTAMAEAAHLINI